ncbi:hypothetical protein Pcinc_041546 [Petrolisthes cinctipes]|uniref:Uncharacterized protein n=1 Tax=Petrolisthes cinctipes TaxID=88211 RepID=A0AAE1EGU0_PETCI|nr:hypothetical protein Pcinc_041546 [Petrolisthes cinctipes]
MQAVIMSRDDGERRKGVAYSPLLAVSEYTLRAEQSSKPSKEAARTLCGLPRPSNKTLVTLVRHPLKAEVC